MKKIQAFGAILILLYLCHSVLFNTHLPQYKLQPHDTNDTNSIDLVKKDFLGKEILRGMCDINISPNDFVVVSFHPSYKFEKRYQTGLMLVLNNDAPQYTLECVADRYLSCKLSDDKIYLTRPDDKFTRIYTLDGKYEGKTDKMEMEPRKDKVTASDGSLYVIQDNALFQQVLRIFPDGTQHTIYKTSYMYSLEVYLYNGLFIIGIICFGGSILLEKHQKWRKHIEEEKKNGKSIWA